MILTILFNYNKLKGAAKILTLDAAALWLKLEKVKL